MSWNSAMVAPSFFAASRAARAMAWGIAILVVGLAAGGVVWAANPPDRTETWVSWRPHRPDPKPPAPQPRRYEAPLFQRERSPPV